MAALNEIKPDFKPKATLPKVNAKDLQPSSRSPVIPVVYDPTADRKKPKKAAKAEKEPEKKPANEDKGELIPGPKKEFEDMSTATIREPTADKKSKQKKKPETEKPASKKEITFPRESFVNEYQYLKVSKKILEKIGWYEKLDARRSKKVTVTLDFDGNALIVKKKSV